MNDMPERQSTPEELCDFLDKLSRSVGSGIIHEVVNGEVHAFQIKHGARVDVY